MDITVGYVTAYHLIDAHGTYIWPVFGQMCESREDAVKEARRLGRKGERGIKLVSIKLRGNMTTKEIVRDDPVQETIE
jgi:hypothetical protein